MEFSYLNIINKPVTFIASHQVGIKTRISIDVGTLWYVKIEKGRKYASLSCKNGYQKDNSSYRLKSLGPLCLWQCFLIVPPISQFLGICCAKSFDGQRFFHIFQAILVYDSEYGVIVHMMFIGYSWIYGNIRCGNAKILSWQELIGNQCNIWFHPTYYTGGGW